MLKWLVNHLIKGWVEATAFVTTGGTSSQFVKGDGSLDGTVYTSQSDIINNLTSTDTDKPLSANMGRVLEAGKFDKTGGEITGSVLISGTGGGGGGTVTIGDNIALGIAASGISYDYGGYSPTDGDFTQSIYFGTGTQATTGTGSYMQIDLGEVKNCFENRMYFNYPLYYNLAYSIDGVNWTFVVGSEGNFVKGTGYNIADIVNVGVISARYWRLGGNGNITGKPNRNYIYEWEIYEGILSGGSPSSLTIEELAGPGERLAAYNSEGKLIESTLTLAPVATSGSYDDLTGKPTIPTNNNQLTNGVGYITNAALNGYALESWVTSQNYLTSASLNGYATESWVTSNFDNYQSWNLKTNGVQRTTIQSGGTLDLIAGTNTSLNYGAGGQVTINSSFNDTTYTAGTGLDLTGTEFSFDTVWGDGRYLQTETDPIFTASPAFGITNTDITNWDEKGVQLTADQPTANIHLRDSAGNIISTLNVGFLNNEGTTLFFNSATDEIELKDDAGNVLSSFPASALMTGVGFGLNLTGSTLELLDSANNVIDSVTLTIANIQGLQAELNLKALKSTNFTAGAGLTGGGTLAADRTFNVNFGTTAGTVAEGNHSHNYQQFPLTQNDGDAIVASGDWNDYLKTGFYRGSNMINASLGSHAWRYVIVTSHIDDFVVQQSIEFGGTTNAYRVKLNGIWQPWVYNASESWVNSQGYATESWSNSNFADIDHVTHEIKSGDYAYSNISDNGHLRAILETMRYDVFRFQPVSNIEYHNGTNWADYSSFADDLKLLLDGTGSNVAVDFAHKKIRFEIIGSARYNATALLVLESDWAQGSYPDITVTLEKWNGSAWDIVDTATFNSTNTDDAHGIHLKGMSVHDGAAPNFRVTVDMVGWTNSGDPSSVVLKNIMLLANYSNPSNNLFSWDYDRQLTFPVVPKVNTETVALLSDIPSLSGYALESWVTSNFDNYQSWNLKVDGVQKKQITSQGVLDLIAGTNVSLQYGADGKVTINSSGGGGSSYTDEQAQDAVGTILSSDFTYDDATPEISLNDIAQSKVTGLVNALAGKVNKAGDVLSGDVTFLDNSNGSVGSSQAKLTNLGLYVGSKRVIFSNGGADIRTNHITVSDIASTGIHLIGADTNGKLINYTDAIPVSQGGTGKTSIGEGKILVGNASGGFNEENFHTHANKAVLDGITLSNISRWDTAFGWGDHAQAGYLEDINLYLKINSVDKETLKNNSVLDFIAGIDIDIDYDENGQVIISSTSSGEANVQSDWDETDAQSDAFIKNKPSLEGQLLVTETTLGTNDILNSDTNPITLIQGVTGKYIDVVRIVLKYNHNTTQFSGGTNFTIRFDDPGTGILNPRWVDYSESKLESFSTETKGTVSIPISTGVEFTSDPLTAGDGDMVVRLYYRIEEF